MRDVRKRHRPGVDQTTLAQACAKSDAENELNFDI